MGYFQSVFRLKIPHAAFLSQTHLVLNVMELKQLENGECSPEGMYDDCYNNEIKEMVNNTLGCILDSMK